MITDIVVVGGGISGLYTALKCLHYGMRVIVLEKMERLGGRIRTVHQDGRVFEAGAGRFHEKHALVRQLIAHFGLHETRIQGAKSYIDDPNFQATEHIQRVIDYVRSHSIPREMLQQIPFLSLCRMVLGVHVASKVVHAFGYNAEFELMNTYDALRMFERDFSGNARYYTCKEGLSALVDSMADTIKDMYGHIFTQTQVTNIKRTQQGFKVSAKDARGKPRVYQCIAVVCAIPKGSLEELKFFSQDQRSLMNTVVPVSLHRIYGNFPVSHGKSWFYDIPRTSTKTHIRQFLPLDKKQGLAMISYADTDDADYWKRYADRGTNALKRQLLKQLHVTFPDVDSIPEPQWLNSYYWPAGVHMWKPGVDSQTVIPQVQQILGVDSAFYIVGEAYAKNQAWIEGALETVESIFPSLTAHFKMQQGGEGAFDRYLAEHGYQLKRKDLTTLKKQFPHVMWVLLRDPTDQQLKLIDVTQWVRMHPGGDVFTHRKYQDITHEFFSIPYHKDSSGKIRDSVIEKIRMYAKAIVL